MKRYQFNKLIRSNLPKRMRKEGIKLSILNLNQDGFAKALKSKLVEESLEVKDTNSRDHLIKELADVMEVIKSLTSIYNISKEEINREQLLKSKINGHFSPRNFIKYIKVPENNSKMIRYLEDKNRLYKFVE